MIFVDFNILIKNTMTLTNKIIIYTIYIIRIKIMNILYITQGNVHPDKDCQRLVKDYLKDYLNDRIMDNYNFTHKSLSEIKNVSLNDYELIVLYFHIKEDNILAIDMLSKYVNDGGCILGIHGAVASFKTSELWFELFGGKFISHPNVDRIKIGDKTILDELYIFRLLSPEILEISSLDGVDSPCIWKNVYGKGKAYYYALGHDLRAVKSDVFQENLYRTLNFCMIDCSD